MSSEIGQRIQWAREAAGLSLPQAARKTDMTPDTLLALEQGRLAPQTTELRLFEAVYGVDYEWLYSGTERVVVVPPTQHMTDADREVLRRVLARMRQL